MNESTPPFGGLICPECQDALRLDIAYDGMSSIAVKGYGYDYSVSLRCENIHCRRSFPICRTNSASAISEIMPTNKKLYIRLTGTMPSLMENISQIRQDYLILSEPMFYPGRNNEIFNVCLECQRKP